MSESVLKTIHNKIIYYKKEIVDFLCRKEIGKLKEKINNKEREINDKEQKIKEAEEKIKELEEKLGKCREAGCSFGDLPFHPMGREHITKVPEEIKEFIKEKEPKERIALHFYHSPMDFDAGCAPIIKANKILLENEYYIVWIHDNDDWGEKMNQNMKHYYKGHEKKCIVCKMRKQDKEIPINFTVIAPCDPDKTLTYMRFRDREALDFGIKFDSAGGVSHYFDDMAKRMLKYYKIDSQ